MNRLPRETIDELQRLGYTFDERGRSCSREIQLSRQGRTLRYLGATRLPVDSNVGSQRRAGRYTGRPRADHVVCR